MIDDAKEDVEKPADSFKSHREPIMIAAHVHTRVRPCQFQTP